MNPTSNCHHEWKWLNAWIDWASHQSHCFLPIHINNHQVVCVGEKDTHCNQYGFYLFRSCSFLSCSSIWYCFVCLSILATGSIVHFHFNQDRIRILFQPNMWVKQHRNNEPQLVIFGIVFLWFILSHLMCCCSFSLV